MYIGSPIYGVQGRVVMVLLVLLVIQLYCDTAHSIGRYFNISNSKY